MNLNEALAQTPHPPQGAYTLVTGKRRIIVAFDGTFWDVLWPGGSPFGFEVQADVVGFLQQEGISLQDGWERLTRLV